jgi:hypothetical protein
MAAIKMVSAALGRRPDDNVSAVTIQYLSNKTIQDIEVNKKREKRTKMIGQAIPVVGIIATLAIVIALISAINRYVNPPLIILPTYTPYPTLASPNNIFVAGQAGPIGQLIPPEGQPQILANGIFTVTENTRAEINQNGASIGLADGSSLYMSAETVFVFTRLQGGVELALEKGAIMVRLNGKFPVSIKTIDDFTAQVSGSIMGVQKSEEPLGVFVDCYEGHCIITGRNVPPSTLGNQLTRYIFYSAGSVNPFEQLYERCNYWKTAIGENAALSLMGNLCVPPTPNIELTKQCEKWLKDNHNEAKCPAATPAK